MDKGLEETCQIVVETVLEKYEELVKNGLDTSKTYSKEGLLSEEHISQILVKSSEVFLSEPILRDLKRHEEELVIVGSIYGDYKNLIDIFKKLGLPSKNKTTPKYLFLGNYVDIAAYGTETFIFLLALKLQHPDQVYLLRGKHECAAITRSNYFFEECKAKYNIRTWKKFCHCFNCLPVAATIDQKIFCCSGGISPDLHKLSDISDEKIARPIEIPDAGLLTDLLWATPTSEIIAFDHGWSENDAGLSYTFDQRPLEKFLRDNQLQSCVCGMSRNLGNDSGFESFFGGKFTTLHSRVFNHESVLQVKSDGAVAVYENDRLKIVQLR